MLSKEMRDLLYAHVLQPYIQINQYEMVAKDIEGHLFQVVAIPKTFDGKTNTGAMPCHALCGHNLHRYHWSCLRCRYRLVWLGKRAPVARIRLHVMMIRNERRLKRVRNAMLKKFISVCGWVLT